MKWLICQLLLFPLVLAVSACGTGGGPSPSPSSAAQTVCGASTIPTPGSSISFAGRVVSFEGPTPYQSELSVFLQQINGQPGSAVYGNEKNWLNSVLNVTINQFGDAISNIKTGDCVVGSGEAQQYLTHPAVTLSAFVAEKLTRADISPAEAPSAQTSVDGRGSDWLIARVLSVRILTTGYRDATVQLENIVDSTSGDQAQPSDGKHIILRDSPNLPAVAAGDVAEVVGADGRYACSDACDARGFLATYLRKLEY